MDNLQAAARVARRILEVIDKLTRHPEIGRRGRLLGTRELMVPGTPYFIPYRIIGTRVELLRVLHGSLEYPAR